MRKLAIIFGTRPEAIKLAPVVFACRAAGLSVRVCVTGQHREMLDQVLANFDLHPDVNLNVMQPGQTLAALTSRTLAALDAYLERERPDAVLVQGDTTTTLCGALTAFYRRIPIGHVEAGLRTGTLDAPWPEEANRVLTTRLTHWHFAPTIQNRDNLLREQVAASRITVTGNTGIDALLLAQARTRLAPPTITGLGSVNQLDGHPVILITSHRRENFGTNLEQICDAIARLAREWPQTRLIYPVHLNPQVRHVVRRRLGQGLPNVVLLDPLSYFEFVALLDRAKLILTDSGGIQEEAPCLGKPILVLRDTTERPEAVASGAARLVGTHTETICAAVSELLTNSTTYQAMAQPRNVYGDGHAATRITEVLVRELAS